MPTKRTFVRNTSTNRVILGGGKGVPMLTLGGQADKDVDKAPNIGQQVEGPRVARYRKGGMGALAERLGLQIG
jgi:hypothetical protein